MEDITYIFSFGEVDSIIVDEEYLHLLSEFRAQNPNVPFIIDTDTDATEGQLSGPFDEAVLEGLKYDIELGKHGWAGLKAQADDENSMLAIPFTSGTTAKPKGVVYTHRSAYLAAVGNIIESGLNYHTGRCGYLWTLPMFHAMGWTFPVGNEGAHFPFSRCLEMFLRHVLSFSWNIPHEAFANSPVT